MRILYGGSVKPRTRRSGAVANVNGALVGGASLKAADFWQSRKYVLEPRAHATAGSSICFQ